MQINSIQLTETGVPIHFTVKAINTQGLEAVAQCSMKTFDVTIPSGRMEADHIKISHPHKISASMVVIDDSPLVEEQFVAVGVGEFYYGHSVKDWHHFELEENPVNEGASGPLEHFASARPGRLSAAAFSTTTERYIYYSYNTWNAWLV